MARRSRSRPRRVDPLIQVRARPAESAQFGKQVAAQLGTLFRIENFDGMLQVEGIAGSQWTIHDYVLGRVGYRNDGSRVTRRGLLGLENDQSVVLEDPLRGDSLVVHGAGYLQVVKLSFKAVSVGPLAPMCLAATRRQIRIPASTVHFQQLAAQHLTGAVATALQSAGLPYSGTGLQQLTRKGLSGSSGFKPLG